MSEQNVERQKSVGDIIKEIEGRKSANKVKAFGVADRLPSLKKDDGVADMLPALKGGGQDYKRKRPRLQNWSIKSGSKNLLKCY